MASRGCVAWGSTSFTCWLTAAEVAASQVGPSASSPSCTAKKTFARSRKKFVAGAFGAYLVGGIAVICVLYFVMLKMTAPKEK